MSGETIIAVKGIVHGAPEKIRIPNGERVVGFGVITPREEFDHKTHRWREAEPVFVVCYAFGKRGEGVLTTLRDGMSIVAQGHLTLRDGAGQTPYLRLTAVGPDLGNHHVIVDPVNLPPRPASHIPRPVPPKPAASPTVHLDHEHEPPGTEPSRPINWWSLTH
ncbi:single-stranded DNA-binding protein [Streptomyces noursei]|uniref:single-stranded DNA-binding protein n=1 Tax=Streptomyces noursei TaxID=1971 RepID=UPI00081D0AF5|nr:single-strand binding protein [Streptomyces noursei ATCC 11455]ANZ22002.1 single-strand binding protein [Streptomyces noursei ATCC 11455]MCZ0996416.1 single-stranded DNA-binding protein [Streptomyces noursei]